MTDQKHLFATLHPIKEVRKIKGVRKDNEPLTAVAIGTVSIRGKVNGDWQNQTLLDVLLVPELSVNLFSIGATYHSTWKYCYV